MINLSWSGKRCRLFSGTQKTLILFSDVGKTYIIYYQFNTLILLIIYIVHISFICCFTGVSVLSTLQVVPKRKYLFCRKICYFQLIVKEKLCLYFILSERNTKSVCQYSVWNDKTARRLIDDKLYRQFTMTLTIKEEAK